MNLDSLRDRFEHPTPLTMGIEEELMLLDADTLELAPRAPELLCAMDDDPRVKLELPAAHVELATLPAPTVTAALEQLRRARADVATAAEALELRLAGAGAHPFSAPLGELNPGARHASMRARFGVAAEAQLICGLHIHVAVGGADAAIAVHDALRSMLPELAALGAAAPWYAGRDSGLASVRPAINRLLPRQGIPPALRSLERYAAELEWGAAAGVVAEPRRWWWELRPHAQHGTLEIRVCDSQPGIRGVGALAGVVHALVDELVARHEAGELPPVAEEWRITENRWSACHDGLGGTMACLDCGRLEPTAERVARMLDGLEAAARRVGCSAQLTDARELLDAGGDAARQRAVGREQGVGGLTAWLAGRFI